MSEPDIKPRTTRLFQITEPDLAELERLLPQICELAVAASAGAQMDGGTKETDKGMRVSARNVQEIISRIRWDYGPHSAVGFISA